MAQPFHDIQVTYNGIGKTTVAWILDSRFDDPFPHMFELQFSQSSAGFDAGEYVTIAQGSKATQLVDTVFRDSGISSLAFYRVQLTTPAGVYKSDFKGLAGNVAGSNLGILKELLRKENILFRKDRGAISGYLFKRRYYGPSCSCTDKNSKTLVSNACAKCAGTGFFDGYFPGIEFPILIESPEVRHAQIQPTGISDVRQLLVRCLVSPVADSKDIWMEADTNKTYEVKEYTVTSRLSYLPVAAKIELRELPLVDTISLLLTLL